MSGKQVFEEFLVEVQFLGLEHYKEIGGIN